MIESNFKFGIIFFQLLYSFFEDQIYLLNEISFSQSNYHSLGFFQQTMTASLIFV